MGVTGAGDIGQSGGNSSHSHVVDIDHGHPGGTTSYLGSHTHSVDLPAFDGGSQTEYSGEHNHVWADYFVDSGGKNIWVSCDSGSGLETVYEWTNGIDGEGTGIFPFAEGYDYIGYSHTFWTDKHGYHAHSYSLDHDHAPVGTSANGGHSHSFSVAPTGTLEKTTSEVAHLPPYYGLLKIMRIR
jgi:hypothetical protein